jgi:hypothetical protein
VLYFCYPNHRNGKPTPGSGKPLFLLFFIIAKITFLLFDYPQKMFLPDKSGNPIIRGRAHLSGAEGEVDGLHLSVHCQHRQIVPLIDRMSKMA